MGSKKTATAAATTDLGAARRRVRRIVRILSLENPRALKLWLTAGEKAVRDRREKNLG